MSWLFSQALVVEYSAANCLDGEPCAQLNVMPTPHKFWRNDKTMDFSKLSQFGLTLQLLTESRGEALLMWFLAGFHAKTLAPQEKGGGIEASRSGLWWEMARIIGEVRPTYAFVENSPMLTTRGLGAVLGDLAALGFDAEWGVLSAADVGALHNRERIWVLASNTNSKHLERRSNNKIYKWPGLQGIVYTRMDQNEQGLRKILRPGLCRKFNGLPNQVDRLRAIGNAQFPCVAATAFELLRERLKNG
jgi:hypothetical protein